MKLLLIENDKTFLNVFTKELEDSQNIKVITALSRDSAFEILQKETFDLVICDLKIPPADGGLDDHIEHGLAVYNKSVEIHPGTPIIILSAFGTLDIVTKLLQEAQGRDVFGARSDYPMKSFIQKGHLPECVTKVKSFADEIEKLNRIEISTGQAKFELTDNEKRILRIFARRLDGLIVDVAELSEGLSSAKTLRLRVIDSRGGLSTIAVAKIAPLNKIEIEKQRYHRYVAPSLDLGSFTTCLDELQAGAGDLGAVFYTLARAYEKSFFDLLSEDQLKAVEVITRLMEITSRWLDGAPLREVEVATLRRELINDDDIIACALLLDTLDWKEFENRKISINHCCQHRDLHGLNILLTDENIPVLIDYGEVDFASASFDAITLEMSILFHPEGKKIRGDWPSKEQASVWEDIDKFVIDCPVPEFIRACRNWAFKVAAGNREIYANAYAYSMRQLKYPDTDHEIATCIISSVINAMNKT